jgi:serine/threonine protein kinase
MNQELVGDRYRIINSIGRGGFSEVFLAFDESLRRNVAIKRLDLISLRATDRERFLREAHILARLRNRHIVTIYSLEERDDHLHIVMEYADQGNLLDLINASPDGLQIDYVVDVGISMCRALSVVHAEGIIHRDVKPDNILLFTEQGEERPVPKLADFGLARDMACTPLTPTDHRVVGTMPYMPPEAILGEEQEADARRDVYALGATLYQALTGHLPRGNEFEEIIRNLRRPATPPRHHRHDIPMWLGKVIVKALANDPNRRYSTMDQMLADLKPDEQEQPVKRLVTHSRVWRIIEDAAAEVLGNAIWWILGAIVVFALTRLYSSFHNGMPGVTERGISAPTSTATATVSPAVSPTHAATIAPAVLPSHTPTPTMATPPTSTPTPSPTPTSTPIPPPTATRTPISTPTPTRTPTPTPAPPGVIIPEPIAPNQGETYRNPLTFAWRGSLRGSQAYQVTARHTERDYVIQSELLTDPSWTTDLPVKEDTDGEWRWTVSVVLYGRTLATSSEWMFWFKQFGATEPDNGNQEPTNTPPPQAEYVHKKWR